MRRALLTGLLCATLLACGGGERGPGGARGGDLEEIRARGVLRVLFPQRVVVDQLPRGGLTLDDERQLIEQFAVEHGLRLVAVPVSSRDEMLPRLLRGDGDVIAANLTATEERRRQVAFTVPVAVVREQLVGSARDEAPPHSVEQLAGRTIHIRRSSSFWSTVEKLTERQPELRVLPVAEELETEEILHSVAHGELDLTVADSNLVDAVRAYELPVKPLMDLTEDRAIAFAVRPDADELREALDRFLSSAQLANRSRTRHTGDLDDMRRRRVLRVLTRNTPSSYFVWRGQLKGFDYELARLFARRNGLRLEMIVPRPGESLFDLLREGRGDLIAASLIPPPERRLDGVVFCRPYNYVDDVIVSRADDRVPRSYAELAGRTIFVNRSSRHWRTLARLEDDFGFRLRSVPPMMGSEDVIRAVAAGTFDLTVSDSQTLAIEMSWRDGLEGGVTLRERLPIAWAVRDTNPELKQAVDRFVRDTYRGLTYNVLYDRYFLDRRSMRTQAAHREIQGDRLSPYDEIVRRHAGEHGFDWRLVVAQMYQESRFDHDAISFAGARGLMQVMPQTAAQLGIEDLSDPEAAIVAGVRYLDWVHDLFDEILSVGDRMWFALAAYNAGPGHVRDARRLAAELGLNPNVWFGQVERAMLLLSQEEYYSRTQHGYCRCSEPVRYVREIRERYNAYVETSVETRAARAEYSSSQGG